MRLRSDEQLVRLFRTGNEEAFRVVHDRYRPRLLAYARQMLGGSRADAEDALQDVFVRAYGALRANDRDVSLRAWLYRIAHNRCIDELRRPAPAPSPDALELVEAPGSDPMAAVEQRESLRRLVADVQRLPEQQRSALLMREISGMAYQDLATALDVTIPAVKSLLVRARIGLAHAAEARDTACEAIRTDLADSHERGVRSSGLVRRHLHDCTGCRAYRRELRALDARLAALVPAIGPAALAAKLLGIGGGGAAAGGGATAAGGATAVGAGATAVGAGAAGVSAGHIVAAVAVAVVSAGGAVEVHRTLGPAQHHRAAAHHAAPAQWPTSPLPAASTNAGAATARTHTVDAARREAVARRLHLRMSPPMVVSDETIAPDPTVGAGPTSIGNGGAAAPVDPMLEPVVPATPPADPAPVPGDDGSDGSDGGTGASGSSSGTVPPPPAPPSTEPPPPDTPPATSVAPPAATAIPPTSAATGGAAYVPQPKRR